jgi:hypothetical protein
MNILQFILQTGDRRELNDQSKSRFTEIFIFKIIGFQVGFVVDKVAPGHIFCEYFGFPCQSSFHQILYPHNHPGQVQ